MKNGIELIAEERQRQTDKEGWSAEHDDGHVYGELAVAAACYAAGRQHTHIIIPHSNCPTQAYGSIAWPWEPEDYKPGNDRIRALVKAGALIAAEIDRLQRLDEKLFIPTTEP